MPTLIQELQWMLRWCEVRFHDLPATADFAQMEERRRIRALQEAIKQLEGTQ